MTNFQRVLFFKKAFLKTKTHNFISYIVDNSVFDHLPPYLKKKCSMKKGVPKNLAKVTEKHLYQSLLFNKTASLQL